MDRDEAARIMHELDAASAQMMAAGVPWAAVRRITEQADRYMDIALA